MVRLGLPLLVLALVCGQHVPVGAGPLETPKNQQEPLAEETQHQIAIFKKAHARFLELYAAERYDEAEPEIKTALGIARRLLGDEHLLTATEYANYAALYASTNRSAEALPLYRKALSIRRAKMRADDPLILSVLEDLQLALFRLGKAAEERETLDQLLPFYDGTPPNNPERLAFALNRRGVLFINAGNTVDARRDIKRGLKLYEQLKGRKHADTALAISNLAVVEVKENHLAKALELFQESYQIRSETLGAGHNLTLQTLGEIAGTADKLKQYDKAIAIAGKIIELRTEILGEGNQTLAGDYNRLAAYAFRAKDYDQAGRALVKAIDIEEKSNGEQSPALLNYLNNLATLMEDLGRYREAEPVYRRRLKILEVRDGVDHPGVINSIVHLGRLNRQIARYDEADKLFFEALKRENSKPQPNSLQLGFIHNARAGLMREIGRFKEADAAYRKTLALFLAYKQTPPDDLARLYDNMGVLALNMNEFEKAEDYGKRALAIFEQTLGADNRSVAISLNNLATAYDYQGRDEEALALLQRAVGIFTKTARAADPMTGVLEDNIAGLYRQLGRVPEAETHYRLAMEALVKAYGEEHPEVALAMSNLAALYGSRKDYDGAHDLYRKAIAINEKAYGPAHPSLANMWRLLGENDFDRGDYDAARKHYLQALQIAERAFGPDHGKTGEVIVRLAALSLWQQNYDEALGYYRRAAKIEEVRLARESEGGTGTDNENRTLFSGLAISAWYVAGEPNASPQDKVLLREEGLRAAQIALKTSAGAALAQMSARFAAGSGELADSVRLRQDLTSRYRQLDKQLIDLVGASPDKRDDQAIARLRADLKNINGEIAGLDQHLATAFPEYASLANPQPLTISDIQSDVKNNEALLFLMTSNEAVYLWVVTDDKADWQRVPLKRTELRAKVAHLRKALDPATATATRGFKVDAPESGKTVKPSFDLAVAHQLYKALLQPFEPLLRDKPHLVLVASDALTGLPFQVLVTEQPPTNLRNEFEIYERTKWLIERHAITTLPSIASLRALRRNAGQGKEAEEVLIGFGDPVFSSEPQKPVVMASTGGYASFFRGGKVNLAALSKLSALPDTRDELLNVAKTLNAPGTSIRLGREATETAVKTLDKEGALGNSRIVYFATHGLVSGDIKGLAEPALALSLPTKASEEDDGLLTASEVTQLKLNADWVVLSACNTASGSEPGAEALSGLARAFFYAGAKSLLVSHWPVYSDAAAQLTTRAFKAIDDERKAGHPIGRAEALRLAMLSLIKNGHGGFEAHPSYWAPFVVVGEGAAE